MCPPANSGIAQNVKAATNEPASSTSETLEGYVIDIACVRKYPRAELAGRARAHTRVSKVVTRSLRTTDT
jgi:hypothetical protein